MSELMVSPPPARPAVSSNSQASSNVVIRAMVLADVEAVCEMAARIWRKHYVPEIVTSGQIEYMLPRIYNPEQIKKNITQRNQRFWIMLQDGQPAGYAAAEPRGEEGVWFLDKLYVDMERQRAGLGARLLRAVIMETQPRELALRVNRKNYKAINFYFRQGFFIEGLDCLDIGSGYVMDDFLMRKIM